MSIFGLQVGVWIEAGSRCETSANNGVAHLLERLAFKVRTFVSQLTGLVREYFVRGSDPLAGPYTEHRSCVTHRPLPRIGPHHASPECCLWTHR